MKFKVFALIVLASLLFIATLRQPAQVSAQAATPSATGQTAGAQDTGAISIGSATVIQSALSTARCTSGIRTRFVEGQMGIVTAVDGSQWTVPAPVTDDSAAVDLFNDCTGNGDNAQGYAAQLKTVVIDPDGVDITGFIFSDNYFELFINGQFVAKDAITFVPFNSSVVRFRVKYPYTIAVKLVDWETHLGIGSEYDNYNVGDGGFIAQFSDGTVTSNEWKVEPFYIAPLDDPSCVNVANGRDSSGCTLQPTCMTQNPDQACQALHFAVPDHWADVGYDDAWWNTATLYQAQDVTKQPAYMQYQDYFKDAQFIWSRNLILDNLVLTRFTVTQPK